MVEIRIDGAKTPTRLAEVRNIIGARHLHVIAGGQPERDAYTVEYQDRADADLAVLTLNCLDGVRAHIREP